MRGWFHHRYRPYFLFNYKIPPPYRKYDDGNRNDRGYPSGKL
nr:MAG TPA: hypothetical protein [Caudoviricetes sp.]